MAVARIWFILGVALCGLGLWAASAVPAWGSALGAVSLVVGVLALGLTFPLLALAAHLRRESRGGTVLRSPRPLSREESRELYRVVDLVRGRMARMIWGLDEGRCEVWLLPAGEWAAPVVRARRLGVGMLGPAICPVTADDLADHTRLLRALSDSLARNVVTGLRGRVRGALLRGMAEWLAACGAAAEGPERRARLHAEAAALGEGEGRGLAALLHGEGARSDVGPLARSFTGFLVHRYGVRAYLRFLSLTDRRRPEAALLLAYQRSVPELERRWRAFLAVSEPAERAS